MIYSICSLVCLKGCRPNVGCGRWARDVSNVGWNIRPMLGRLHVAYTNMTFVAAVLATPPRVAPPLPLCPCCCYELCPCCADPLLLNHTGSGSVWLLRCRTNGKILRKVEGCPVYLVDSSLPEPCDFASMTNNATTAKATQCKHNRCPSRHTKGALWVCRLLMHTGC